MYEFWQRDVALQRLYIGFEITHSSFSRPEFSNATISISITTILRIDTLDELINVIVI